MASCKLGPGDAAGAAEMFHVLGERQGEGGTVLGDSAAATAFMTAAHALTPYFFAGDCSTDTEPSEASGALRFVRRAATNGEGTVAGPARGGTSESLARRTGSRRLPRFRAAPRLGSTGGD